MSTQPPTPSPARSTRPAARTPLAFLAIAGTCVVAAGVGGYVAQSHRTAELPAVEARPAQATPAATPAIPSGSPEVTSPAPVESATIATPSEAEAPVSRSPRAVPSSEPVEKPVKDRKPSDATASRTARVAAAAPAPQDTGAGPKH